MTYIMLVHSLTLPEAYLHLHLESKRAFFVYPQDLAVLRRIEDRLAQDRRLRSAPVGHLEPAHAVHGQGKWKGGWGLSWSVPKEVQAAEDKKARDRVETIKRNSAWFNVSLLLFGLLRESRLMRLFTESLLRGKLPLQDRRLPLPRQPQSRVQPSDASRSRCVLLPLSLKLSSDQVRSSLSQASRTSSLSANRPSSLPLRLQHRSTLTPIITITTIMRTPRTLLRPTPSSTTSSRRAGFRSSTCSRSATTASRPFDQ